MRLVRRPEQRWLLARARRLEHRTWGSTAAPWHARLEEIDTARFIAAREVPHAGLSAVVEHSREPVLVAAGCEGNPTSAWPALGAWWSYGDRFFERHSNVKPVVLKEPGAVSRRGGSTESGGVSDHFMGYMADEGADEDGTGSSDDEPTTPPAAAPQRRLREVSRHLLGSSSVIFSTERQGLYAAMTTHDVPLGSPWSRGDPDAAALRALSLHPVVSVGGRYQSQSELELQSEREQLAYDDGYGGHGGGLAFHRHDANWLTLLSGRKLWCFAPPVAVPHVGRVEPEALLDDPSVRLAVQSPGDIMVVPRGWWHATYNMPDESVGDIRDDPVNLALRGIAIGIGGLGRSPGLHWEVAEGDVDRLQEGWEAAQRAAKAHERASAELEAHEGSSFNATGDPIGVLWDGAKQRYSASITLPGGEVSDLGSFDDKAEATRRYNKVAGGFGLPLMPSPPEDPLAVKTPAMKTLMHTAAYHGHLAVCEWLLAKAIESPRHDAADADGPSVADDRGTASRLALVNAKDRLGFSPLFFAIARGHREVASWLREHGAEEVKA